MRIHVQVAESPERLPGNWNTAERWERIFRSLGHEVTCGNVLPGSCDVVVALHARRAHATLVEASARSPRPRLIVALTGTDLYADLAGGSAEVEDSLERSDAIVVLQSDALERVPARWRARARTIVQSAAPTEGVTRPEAPPYEALVVGNQRAERDVLIVARAARRLPADTPLHVTWIGSARDATGEAAAKEEQTRNSRFTWRGRLPHAEARRAIASAHVVVIPSRAEGSSNVLSEAAVDGVPVIATRIPALVAALGPDHPGLYEPDDESGLAELLARFTGDADFRATLTAASFALRDPFSPATEREAWKTLLESVDA